MSSKVFDPKKLAKLNNPQRLLDIPVDHLWKILNAKRAGTMVDIGAGTGFFCIPFLDYVHKVYACDFSQTMVDWMVENLKDYPRVIPTKMENNTVPLEDNVCEILSMMNLHHELDSPEKTIIECRRLLKPGGKILIVDWKQEEMSQGPPLHIRVSPSTVCTQLESSGFTNIVVDESLELHFIVAGELQRFEKVNR